MLCLAYGVGLWGATSVLGLGGWPALLAPILPALIAGRYWREALVIGFIVLGFAILSGSAGAPTP